MNTTAVLYLSAVVQTYASAKTLVKQISQSAGMNRRQRTDLAAALATMSREGVRVCRLQGLSLGSAGLPTVAVVLPDGQFGIGVAFADETPADLPATEAWCREAADELEPGFVMLAIPVGVVAGGLQ